MTIASLEDVTTLVPPFTGRHAEMAELRVHLNDPARRLITLVGPGGAGKTRLALQAAAEGHAAFEDGVYRVPMGPLSSGEFIISTIADAVRFTRHSADDPQQQLLDYLQQQSVLLLVDGFEHLIEYAAILEEIHAACPGVTLLITSRVPLNLAEEVVLRVQGLPYPRAEDAADAPLGDAARLFITCARQARPDFTPDAAEHRHILRICRLLEGLPLGIELASAWVRVLPCEDIAEEIETNLDFLATTVRDLPARHRSLRAVFDYSWTLLAPEEQEALKAMTVFRGGFHPKAAREIVGADTATLKALVDPSLLRYYEELNRYQMPLALRQYAEEKLASAERRCIRTRHSHYYAAFLREREADVKYERQKESTREIAQEIENVRVAWGWAVRQRDTATLLHAIMPLCHFHNVRSWIQEAFDLVHRALVTLEGDDPDDAHQQQGRGLCLCRLRGRASWFAMKLGDYGLAEALARQAIADAQALKRLEEKAEAQHTLGYIQHRLGDHQEAKALFQESLRICRTTQNTLCVIDNLNALGNIAHTMGELEAVKHLREESLRICTDVGYISGMAVILNNLAGVYFVEGDYAQARALYQKSLALSKELNSRRGQGSVLVGLGDIAYCEENLGEAMDLYMQGREAYAASGHRWGVAYIDLRVGQLLEAQGHLRQAQDLLNQGLSQAQAVQNRWGVAYGHILLGGVVAELGALDEAAQHLDEGVRLAVEMQTTPLLMQAVVNSARLLHIQGDNERAARYLRAVLAHPFLEYHLRIKTERLLKTITGGAPSLTETPPSFQTVIEEITASE